jgi:hypothetical protein
MNRYCICALVTLACVAWGAFATEPGNAKLPYEPTDAYEKREILGWKIVVNRQFVRDKPGLATQTLRQLEHQLYNIHRVVPPPAIEKLQRIAIWVEHREPHHPCMAYHPAAGWLKSHDMNPDKARCVEIANAENFLTWTLHQPWMVLHELAHGYHHQFLGGYDNPQIRAAHERAVANGSYAAVLRVNGTDGKHYAATNPMEYFAEATEAYFGTNDFFPFVRAELKRHDPAGYELIESLWGAAKKRP